MKKQTFTLLICLISFSAMTISCKSKKDASETPNVQSEMELKVAEYAFVDLHSDLYNNLSENEKELIPIFMQIGEIMDGLFRKQTF
ncbi:MAG TPA: Zn-dependent hydrolase, partial [Bacteroidales bacterium]|nr:Zn-dependent hydrolase [Bacteroidales bacterium]